VLQKEDLQDVADSNKGGFLGEQIWDHMVVLNASPVYLDGHT